MINTYKGECPYVKGIHSIDVNYYYIPILGALSKNYKKDSFDCDFIDECPEADDCPIYQNASLVLTE